jgi:hypothetical protein
VLSVYTKQTAIAAPAAALAVSLAFNWRPTVIAALSGAALWLIAFGWLEWSTGGGFGRHIIAYNASGFSTKLLIARLPILWGYAFLFVSAICALALLWRDEARASSGIARPCVSSKRVVLAIMTLWLIFATAMLVAIGHWGAWVNYLVDWLCVCAVLAGMLAALVWQTIFVNRALGGMERASVYLYLGLALLVAADGRFRHPPLDDPALNEIRQSLVREIIQATRPVLSDDMVLLLRGAREVPIEPAMFTMLAITGNWDQTSFLQLLMNGFFAFIVIHDKGRYTDEMLSAINLAYPRVEQLGPYIIRRPPES